MSKSDVKKRDPRVIIDRSHGRRVDWVDDIREEILSSDQFDAIDKARLADCIVGRYGIPIGEVNRMIDCMRRKYDISPPSR